MMFGGGLSSAISRMGRMPQQQPALGAGMMPEKRGFGAKLGDVVLNYAAGMGNPIAQMTLQDRAQQRAFGQQQQEWDRRQQQQAQAAHQEWVARETWQRANPAPASPTALQSNYEYLQRTNPALAQQYLESQAAAPPLVVPNADGTRTIYPAGAVPRGPVQRPQVGATIADPRQAGGAVPGGPRPFR